MRRVVVHADTLSLMSPGEVYLKRRESHYIRKVLRMAPGDPIELIDGRGTLGRGEVTGVDGDAVRVFLQEFGKSTALESPLEIHLLMGLPKGKRWDMILQKTTELGITSLRPVMTARCELSIPADRLPGRLERWRSITAEAARQCGRACAPEILPPSSLDQALHDLHELTPDLQLVAWEEASGQKDTTLEAILSASGARRVALFVGPEGGLTESEVQQCTRQGFDVVGLGPRILRAETAAMVFTALVQYRLGDMA